MKYQVKVDQRVVTQARVLIGDLEQWINQLRNDVQTLGLDRDIFHQRVTRFLEETRDEIEANGRTALEQRVAQLRRDFNDAMTETSMSFVRIQQELEGRGARLSSSVILCTLDS